MQIVPLETRNLSEAAALLAAAFFDYPMFASYFPNPIRRSRILPWYLRNVLRCALHYGEIFTTRDMGGVLFALPPGHTSLTLWEYARHGFLFTPLVLGLRCYRRSMECENFVDRVHEEIMGSRPHSYLWGVAVDPKHQGEGIGSALLRAYLHWVDSQQMPIYLETHDARNVGYYQKHGFELVLATSISKHHLPIWCMRRLPQSVASGDA